MVAGPRAINTAKKQKPDNDSSSHPIPYSMNKYIRAGLMPIACPTRSRCPVQLVPCCWTPIPLSPVGALVPALASNSRVPRRGLIAASTEIGSVVQHNAIQHAAGKSESPPEHMFEFHSQTYLGKSVERGVSIVCTLVPLSRSASLSETTRRILHFALLLQFPAKALNLLCAPVDYRVRG
ncbi:hypothetical protein CC86DRAFT_173002 [Ophiobolus disseminans]|uniref:Uncharacterized protein n=1 Tax=Ophiobolus disseminans TaxID=1469910 RepID=A0A6A7A9Y0_9PLEO|nr:hypothetical protein CC86DRAFT_173002 [Ophiobolus disseminans]